MLMCRTTTLNKKIVLTTSIYLFSAISAFAHSDMCLFRKYGKVQTSMYYGFYEHEERNKAVIIARPTDLPLNELNYKQEIRLLFRHIYVEKSRSEYALSFSAYDKERRKIGISVESQSYDAEKILQSTEYAVKDYKYLISSNKDTIISGKTAAFDYDENIWKNKKSLSVTAIPKVDKFSRNFTTEKHTIPDLHPKFYTFDVKFVHGDIVAISVEQYYKTQFGSYNRNMTYGISDDYFCDDLDEVLNREKTCTKKQL